MSPEQLKELAKLAERVQNEEYRDESGQAFEPYRLAIGTFKLIEAYQQALKGL